ncbi:hypothetical protein GQ43DRAFT_461637 [Delitschia confertaspora ATCC 74209]|uniref:Uncharacterized protein n=1 Tax=Delitschia confertaspora ATCC 74209 TaxID=1513339 RepID=A0A9P4MU84_9PLEO|nr:hypothetical protein GQ43DRAFT_461637 [Delitschia confertaspora ATCC 74209]
MVSSSKRKAPDGFDALNSGRSRKKAAKRSIIDDENPALKSVDPPLRRTSFAPHAGSQDRTLSLWPPVRAVGDIRRTRAYVANQKYFLTSLFNEIENSRPTDNVLKLDSSNESGSTSGDSGASEAVDVQMTEMEDVPDEQTAEATTASTEHLEPSETTETSSACVSDGYGWVDLHQDIPACVMPPSPSPAKVHFGLEQGIFAADDLTTVDIKDEFAEDGIEPEGQPPKRSVWIPIASTDPGPPLKGIKNEELLRIPTRHRHYDKEKVFEFVKFSPGLFNWENAEHIEALRAWRRQIYLRAGCNKLKQVIPFTNEETGWLELYHYRVLTRLRNTIDKLRLPVTSEVVHDFNRYFVGRVMISREGQTLPPREPRVANSISSFQTRQTGTIYGVRKLSKDLLVNRQGKKVYRPKITTEDLEKFLAQRSRIQDKNDEMTWAQLNIELLPEEKTDAALHDKEAEFCTCFRCREDPESMVIPGESGKRVSRKKLVRWPGSVRPTSRKTTSEPSREPAGQQVIDCQSPTAEVSSRGTPEKLERDTSAIDWSEEQLRRLAQLIPTRAFRSFVERYQKGTPSPEDLLEALNGVP